MVPLVQGNSRDFRSGFSENDAARWVISQHIFTQKMKPRKVEAIFIVNMAMIHVGGPKLVPTLVLKHHIAFRVGRLVC